MIAVVLMIITPIAAKTNISAAGRPGRPPARDGGGQRAKSGLFERERSQKPIIAVSVGTTIPEHAPGG